MSWLPALRTAINTDQPMAGDSFCQIAKSTTPQSPAHRGSSNDRSVWITNALSATDSYEHAVDSIRGHSSERPPVTSSTVFIGLADQRGGPAARPGSYHGRFRGTIGDWPDTIAPWIGYRFGSRLERTSAIPVQ